MVAAYDGLARYADLRGGRRHVDDVPGAAGEHRGEGELAAEDHAVHVHVELAAAPAVVLVQERPDVHDAGVVDQDVDRADLALDPLQECGERVAVGDVERRAERSARLGREVGVEVADRHAGPAGHQRTGRRETDPAPASGHSDDTLGNLTLRHRGARVPSRTGMDWEAEGLLEGLTDDAARDARRALLDKLQAEGVPVEELRQAWPSSGSRCCPSTACSPPRRATRRATSPTSRVSTSTGSRPSAARSGSPVPDPDERVYGRDRPRVGQARPPVPRGRAARARTRWRSQRVLGRGMARYAESMRDARRPDVPRGRDRRGRARQPLERVAADR